MKKALSLGFAWYDKEQWELLRLKSTDPEELDSSFEEWEANAIAAELQFKANGLRILRVHIRAADMIEWCNKKAQPLNRSARSAFAAERLHHSERKRKV